MNINSFDLFTQIEDIMEIPIELILEEIYKDEEKEELN